MADLLGPGVGTLAAILLMNTVQTLLTTFLICIPVIFAALIVPGGFRVVPVALMVLTAVLGWFSTSILNPPRTERSLIIAQYWDAMWEIKVNIALEIGGLFYLLAMMLMRSGDDWVRKCEVQSSAPLAKGPIPV